MRHNFILDLDNILRQTYLAIVSFYRQFPDFENYWLIEDDVVFKGNFVNFFDFYKNSTADLIAPDCGANTDPNNDWYNSPYNRIEGNYKISVPTAGGLAFVLRLSNKLLKEISRLTEEKIYGHIESFPQTVCNEDGFELYSMKNDPFFDIQYCNWCHNFKEEHIINIPENKLIHAYKF